MFEKIGLYDFDTLITDILVMNEDQQIEMFYLLCLSNYEELSKFLKETFSNGNKNSFLYKLLKGITFSKYLNHKLLSIDILHILYKNDFKENTFIKNKIKFYINDTNIKVVQKIVEITLEYIAIKEKTENFEEFQNFIFGVVVDLYKSPFESNRIQSIKFLRFLTKNLSKLNYAIDVLIKDESYRVRYNLAKEILFASQLETVKNDGPSKITNIRNQEPSKIINVRNDEQIKECYDPKLILKIINILKTDKIDLVKEMVYDSPSFYKNNSPEEILRVLEIVNNRNGSLKSILIKNIIKHTDLLEYKDNSHFVSKFIDKYIMTSIKTYDFIFEIEGMDILPYINKIYKEFISNTMEYNKMLGLLENIKKYFIRIKENGLYKIIFTNKHALEELIANIIDLLENKVHVIRKVSSELLVYLYNYENCGVNNTINDNCNVFNNIINSDCNVNIKNDSIKCKKSKKCFFNDIFTGNLRNKIISLCNHSKKQIVQDSYEIRNILE